MSSATTLNCHTAGSMHTAAAAGKAQARMALPVVPPARSMQHRAAHGMAAVLPTKTACSTLGNSTRAVGSSRRAGHITAAVASDTLCTQDSTPQQPTVDFLGVVNDMQTARGIVHTAVVSNHVYSMLTDYDMCPSVFRSVARSKTLQLDDGGKQVIQAGKWQFLWFKGTFDVRLNVREHPDDRTVVFTLAESTFMRNFEGRWQIHALPDGGTCAEYYLAVQPLFPIPAAVAPYTSGIFKKQVSDLLEDLQTELDRQIADGVAPMA